ncbi:antibiotic biosynthesis monooxygenase family protein [Tessaracoccus antarcticus]|uniref:Antibiotic biosynthesis monooxygenase n=1 Tax=Tessaracoccus antarcticus TaxID=2479848 RepID=A0A3M0GBM9_9ACTN|nr:antibiotic biosynthesis monooxygenase family protein [Tessaracoccus antarcticus]RMB59962.1 antibiotic biosynthesis monooxygenase [Tessaracoccus antarcticus]
MLAISRFQNVWLTFRADAEGVADFWRQRPGCLGVDVVRNLDDQDLWAIVSRWENVGAYRRSFNGFDAKMILTPVLGRAVDEPSAYLPPDELGENVPRRA